MLTINNFLITYIQLKPYPPNLPFLMHLYHKNDTRTWNQGSYIGGKQQANLCFFPEHGASSINLLFSNF